MTRLKDLLRSHGYKCDEATFKDTLVDLYHATSPSWTVDQHICHSAEAEAFGDLVRKRTRMPNLSTYDINMILLGLRKHGGALTAKPKAAKKPKGELLPLG